MFQAYIFIKINIAKRAELPNPQAIARVQIFRALGQPVRMINDTNKLALVIEVLARIAELICRYAVAESLYIHGASKAATKLGRAVVKLYASNRASDRLFPPLTSAS